MILIELTNPAAEPVTLADAKAWARIDRADEDALIARLIAAARETVERETGLVLAQRAFRLVLDHWPQEGRIMVGRRPVTTVTGVTLYDGEGNATAADAEDIAILGGEILVLSPGLRSACGIEIELEAGLTAETVPEGIKVAILRIVAASYETRGLVEAAMQPAIVPPLARALLAPFRRVRL